MLTMARKSYHARRPKIIEGRIYTRVVPVAGLKRSVRTGDRLSLPTGEYEVVYCTIRQAWLKRIPVDC